MKKTSRSLPVRPKKERKAAKNRFVVIAAVFMILGHVLYFKDSSLYDPARYRPVAPAEIVATIVDKPLEKPKPAPVAAAPVVIAPPVQTVSPTMIPPAARHAPVIAIVIDDMGVDAKRSRQMMAMTSGLTLAFLPYGEKTPELAARAQAQGHEIMIHQPMEPLDGAKDAGQDILVRGMSAEAMAEVLDRARERVPGAKGINNHMGSALTQDRTAMQNFMQALSGSGFYFLDSRTIGSSVAEDEAVKAGVPTLGRDVFLDHVQNPRAVEASLNRLVTIAKKQGYAVGIGHPHDVTIAVLVPWLKKLDQNGVRLVTLGDLVQRRQIPVSTNSPPSAPPE